VGDGHIGIQEEKKDMTVKIFLLKYNLYFYIKYHYSYDIVLNYI